MSALSTLTTDQAQRLFRVYLSAMSEPGTVYRLDLPGVSPVAAPLLTLADLMSPVAALETSTPDDTDGLAREIARVTGAELVEPGRARFALALSEPAADSLRSVYTATAENPHAACVVIQRVEKLDAGTELTLRGPGIDGARMLRIDGLSNQFFETRNEMCADFPAGLDLVFVTDDGEVAAVPRSTTLTVEGAQQ